MDRLSRKILARFERMEPKYILEQHRKGILASLHQRGVKGRTWKRIRLQPGADRDPVVAALIGILQRIESAISKLNEGDVSGALFNVVHLYETALSVRGFTMLKAARKGASKGGNNRVKGMVPTLEDREKLILALDREGLLLKVIATRAKCSVPTVSSTLKKHGRSRRKPISSA